MESHHIVVATLLAILFFLIAWSSLRCHVTEHQDVWVKLIPEYGNVHARFQDVRQSLGYQKVLDTFLARNHPRHRRSVTSTGSFTPAPGTQVTPTTPVDGSIIVPTFGRLTCTRQNAQDAYDTITIDIDFINLALNFFTFPKNSTTGKYLSNMECTLTFAAMQYQEIFVDFPGCQLEQPDTICGIDELRILQRDTMTGEMFNKTICKQANSFGATNTNLHNLQISFSTNSINEGFGCSGYFMAYDIPGSGQGRRRRKKRSTDLIDVIQNFTAAQVAGKACPTGDFLLGPESTEATCQMSKSMVQSANALSCKQLGSVPPILAPIFKPFVQCVSKLYDTIAEKNDAVCEAIRCNLHHSDCFMDYFEMHCGLCSWLTNTYGATGDSSRFGPTLEPVYLSYCEDTLSV